MFIDALLHLPRVEKQKIKNMNNLASFDHYFGRHTLAYGREVWVRELVRLLCCVLGQNTFLSQCLSPTQEFIWVLTNYRRSLMKCWGRLCDGLASLLGESGNTPSCFMLHGNRNELRLNGPLSTNTNSIF